MRTLNPEMDKTDSFRSSINIDENFSSDEAKENLKKVIKFFASSLLYTGFFIGTFLYAVFGIYGTVGFLLGNIVYNLFFSKKDDKS